MPGQIGEDLACCVLALREQGVAQLPVAVRVGVKRLGHVLSRHLEQRADTR